MFLMDPEPVTGSFHSHIAQRGQSGGVHGDGCSRSLGGE